MEILKVYTDGACSGNPGPGGYGAIIIDENNNEKIISGGAKTTTNNQMEMLALIKSLEYIYEAYDTQKIRINLIVDSQYVLKGCTEWLSSWKKKNWKGSSGPVKNRELWEKIDQLISNLNIEWKWVKGHSGDKYNEIVDKVAVSEIEKYR